MTLVQGPTAEGHAYLRKAALILASIGAVALSGCVKYHSRALDPPRSEQQFRARTLNDAGLGSFLKRADWPPPRLGLNDLTAVAFYFNPDLDVARAQVRGAQAAILTAKARPNPSLSLGGGWTNSPESPVVFHFDPAITLETAGKRGWRILEAEKLAEAARVQVAETAWRVRSRVRAAWLDYVMAARSLEVLRNERDVRAEAVAILEKRLSVGEAARPDVSVARAALVSVELEAKAAETAVAGSRRDFGRGDRTALFARRGCRGAASHPRFPAAGRGAESRTSASGRYSPRPARIRGRRSQAAPGGRQSVSGHFTQPRIRFRRGASQNHIRPVLGHSAAQPQPGPDRRSGSPSRRSGGALRCAASSGDRRNGDRAGPLSGRVGGTRRCRRAARPHATGARGRCAPRRRCRRGRPSRAGKCEGRERGGGAGALGRHAPRPDALGALEDAVQQPLEPGAAWPDPEIKP